MVPAFTGLGAPYWDMYARGSIYGITRATGRPQLARAVIESIAYQVQDLIIAMEKDSGIMLKQLRADGGASQSDVLMQFQSDMLNVPIDRKRRMYGHGGRHAGWPLLRLLVRI